MKETPKTPTGGISGFFTRLWHTISFLWIGFKQNLVEIFTPHRKFDLKKVPRRPGEVVVITGGARGIGIEVIRKLLTLHMHVVLGCRRVPAGKDAVGMLRSEGVTTGSVDYISLDLASLESVRNFADKVLKKYPKIHLLINNGGIMTTPYDVTLDGNESQFQVNYLSHFLLTNLLLPPLIKAGRAGKASRIVNVSSVAHYGGKINFKDINMEKMYSRNMAYMSSKLMQVVNSKYLDAKLQKEGVHVRAFSVHPGVVKTDLYEHICIVRTLGFIFRLIYKSPEQGADGVTFVAISSKFEGDGGHYFQNCKKCSVNPLAKKQSVQQQLWETSCKLTGWTDVPISEIVQQLLNYKYTGRSEVDSKANKSSKEGGQIAGSLSDSDSDSDAPSVAGTANSKSKSTYNECPKPDEIIVIPRNTENSEVQNSESTNNKTTTSPGNQEEYVEEFVSSVIQSATKTASKLQTETDSVAVDDDPRRASVLTAKSSISSVVSCNENASTTSTVRSIEEVSSINTLVEENHVLAEVAEQFNTTSTSQEEIVVVSTTVTMETGEEVVQLDYDNEQYNGSSESSQDGEFNSSSNKSTSSKPQ